jgi:hypothetical protein
MTTSTPPRTPIVGITGRAGSGKTTASNWFLRNHKNCIALSFARPLKRMMLELIRDAVPKNWPHSPSAYMTNPDLKNEPIPFLGNQTARRIMQTLGTEWGRNAVHPDFWVDMAATRVERTLGSPFHQGEDMHVRIVFDDVRFANEADMIRRYGGTILRLERADAAPVEAHASETLDFGHDTLLRNDSDDVEAFYARLAEIWPPTA